MSVRQVDQRPNLARLYARATVTARGRHGDRLPDTTLALRDVAIDRHHLLGYADVCGFRKSDVLPPTYPHVLAFPLAVTLMVDPAFPFALPGLVHVGNRITQRRPLLADERLTLGVRAADLRDHSRGRQFDMITEVTVGGEPVWSEASTYLHRERRPHSASPIPSAREGSQTPAPLWGGSGRGSQPTAIWRVPRDIGRRYAAVSGDVNPIHLNPLIAKLFGFRRSIAHGMWLKAHCLAALEGRLPDELTATVEFKSPLFLPSTVTFYSHAADGDWAIAVSQPRSGRPHLTGSVVG